METGKYVAGGPAYGKTIRTVIAAMAAELRSENAGQYRSDPIPTARARRRTDHSVSCLAQACCIA